MTDVERTLLEHYNLSSLYPNEWPAEKDDIDDEEIPRPSASLHRVSRLSALGRGHSIGSNRSIPGSQKDKDGLETLVQKDEADPLGESASVVQKLRQRGVPVHEDVALRKCPFCYSFGSTAFDAHREPLSALLHDLLPYSVPFRSTQ